MHVTFLSVFLSMSYRIPSGLSLSLSCRPRGVCTPPLEKFGRGACVCFCSLRVKNGWRIQSPLLSPRRNDCLFKPSKEIQRGIPSSSSLPNKTLNNPSPYTCFLLIIILTSPNISRRFKTHPTNLSATWRLFVQSLDSSSFLFASSSIRRSLGCRWF